jgi:site-specific recombinase XerD
LPSVSRRHTYCTHAIAAGVPVDVVRENAGHASLTTTSIYVKPGMARRVQAGARLAAWAAR